KKQAFVKAFEQHNGYRPNFMVVSGYDGMHLIYEALKKSNGSADSKTLMSAMKGMAWESPRGPMSIDRETGDVIHNIYIRKVEKVSGELYSVEFATFEAVKDMRPATKCHECGQQHGGDRRRRRERAADHGPPPPP